MALRDRALEYLGPTGLREGDVTRPWVSRWSISQEGLEYLLGVLRRSNPAECRAVAANLLDALTLPPPGE